jgi:hypothetical protein
VVPFFAGQDLQPWASTGEGTYDLDAFDPDWERRLRAYLTAAAERDLVVSLELWDDWSVTRGVGGAYDPGPDRAWNAHPFNPRNNVNYGEDVLSATTRECDAPFYATIPPGERGPVLDRQRRYADHLASIAAGYPNVVYDVSNESRASLEWSTYWADYLRDAVDADRLVGDMPSVDRDERRGECDPDLCPPTLLEDDRYDYVDCSQALTRHALGDDVHDLVAGVGERVAEYYDRMAAADTVKPVVVSKDYTNEDPDGRPVVWSKFLAGTASVRFHRPMPEMWDDPPDTAAFDFETVERLGAFVAETEFWRQRPDHDAVSAVPSDAVALARSRPGEEYVVAVVDGDGGRLAVEVEPGTYAVRWYDPGTGAFTRVGERTVDGALRSTVPDGTETQVLHARRTG